MATKKTSFSSSSSDAAEFARLVLIERELFSHLTGISKAIAKLPTDLQHRIRKDCGQFVDSGVMPPGGWISH